MKSDYMTPKEREQFNLKRLKRKALGFCGWDTIKTKSELLNLLEESCVVQDRKEAIDFLEFNEGKILNYSLRYYLRIDKVVDSEDVERYRIQARSGCE